MEQKTRLFNRDFTMVVIGQVISLFGNAVLRFALPLYLLKETGSPTLFGLVSACSFAPVVILSMAGGILADRLNKRNIMVVLDFCTAALTAVFYFALGNLSPVPLFLTTLMLLYGISGTYQPAVQASIPLLVSSENLMAGNAVINQVNTLSGLLGPVLGGMMFGAWGIYPILILSIFCFTVSAVMEIFICIPHERRPAKESIIKIVKEDIKESYCFVRTEKPILFSIVFLAFLFNLVLSSVMTVGIPVLITQALQMSDAMYGFTQGALALGGLCGGLFAAAGTEKLKLRNAYLLLGICSLSTAVMGISLIPGISALVSYWVITAMSFTAMGASSLFMVQIYTMVQKETPRQLVGKIIAALIAVALCGQPVGQAVYGALFEIFHKSVWMILLGASLASLLLFGYAKKIFRRIED